MFLSSAQYNRADDPKERASASLLWESPIAGVPAASRGAPVNQLQNKIKGKTSEKRVFAGRNKRITNMTVRELLNLNCCSCIFQFLLNFVRLSFWNAFFNCFRRTFHKIFCFFQSKRGNFTNNFNNVDLVFACFG